jgi:hypothetical protein
MEIVEIVDGKKLNDIRWNAFGMIKILRLLTMQ